MNSRDTPKGSIRLFVGMTLMSVLIIYSLSASPRTLMGATPTRNTTATTPTTNTTATTPSDFFALYHKGVALINSGKYNESIAAFDKALAINPHYFFALYNKAVALNALGKYNESIAAFDKALAIDPSNTSALTGKKLDLEALNRTHITNKSVNVIQPKNLAQSNNTNILRIIIP